MGNQPAEQADRRTEHHVLWHCALLASSEYAILRESESGYQLRGLTVRADERTGLVLKYGDDLWHAAAGPAGKWG